jgi:hypothetical protein
VTFVGFLLRFYYGGRRKNTTHQSLSSRGSNPANDPRRGLDYNYFGIV